MSYTYEDLSPNGHQTMIQRIFSKLKGWIESTFQVKSVVMTYSEYMQLTEAEKDDGTIRFLTDCPDIDYMYYDAETEYWIVDEEFVSYDPETEYIVLGG